MRSNLLCRSLTLCESYSGTCCVMQRVIFFVKGDLGYEHQEVNTECGVDRYARYADLGRWAGLRVINMQFRTDVAQSLGRLHRIL